MTARVPAYALYGETLRGRFPDELHIETIVVRSLIHDWNIRPHRHQDLFQFFLVTQGGGAAIVEGVEHRLAPPSLVVLPPMTVHGFQFEPDTAGFVASIPAALLETALASHQPFKDALCRHAVRIAGPAETAALAKLMACTLDEFSRREEARGPALQSLAALIAIGFARLLSGATDTHASAGAARAIVARFARLVESDFRAGLPLAAYARQLGVSVPHLSRLCREILGCPALAIVHDRIMLEARRNLVYTAMTVTEISESLGFSDPAYFSRFFTARAGMRPTAFRAHQQGRTRDPREVPGRGDDKGGAGKAGPNARKTCNHTI